VVKRHIDESPTEVLEAPEVTAARVSYPIALLAIEVVKPTFKALNPSAVLELMNTLLVYP
jgi:hypothetical protein